MSGLNFEVESQELSPVQQQNPFGEEASVGASAEEQLLLEVANFDENALIERESEDVLAHEVLMGQMVANDESIEDQLLAVDETVEINDSSGIIIQEQFAPEEDEEEGPVPEDVPEEIELEEEEFPDVDEDQAIEGEGEIDDLELLEGDQASASFREENSLLLEESASLKSFTLTKTTKASASKTQKNIPTRILTADTTHVPIQPSDIIEYEWPLKSRDRYFIQEQICQLLDVNSFKRKYPNLSRRTVESAERDYLIKELGLTTMLPSTYLTALQSLEVHDLMSREYPQIYSAYQKACAEKLKRSMVEKQKELDLLKLDKKKMEELRQKAIRSASNFNSDLQAVRKERTHFLDIQTNIIQSPLNKWLRMKPEYTRPSNYPAFVLPGQFTSHYKTYNQKELRRLPFCTVMENDDLFVPKRPPSPPSCRVTEEELNALKAPVELKDQRSNSVRSLTSLKQEYVQTPSPSSNSSLKRGNPGDSGDSSAPPAKSARRASGARKTSQMNHVQQQVSLDAHSTPSPKNRGASSKGPDQGGAPLCFVCHQVDPPPGDNTTKTSYHLTISCASCQHSYHSSCLNYSKQMAESASKYAWCCIECKTCTVCEKPDREEAMVCCDICDRGYHTFCIGLSKTPSGVWHCMNCVTTNNNKS